MGTQVSAQKRGANLGHPIFGCCGFHLLDAAVSSAGLLDGIEKLARSAGFELACGEGLSDVADGVADGIEVVQRLDFEPVRRSEEHTSELQSLRHLVCR